MSSIDRVRPEAIPTGLDLTREVLVRLRDRPYSGHPDGTCEGCPFASPPLDSDGRVEPWENVKNDPTEAYFRCFLPSRDPSVVEWGEYAPCQEREWFEAALMGLELTCEHQWRYFPTLATNPERSARECVLCGRKESQTGTTYLGDGSRLPGSGWVVDNG